MDREDLRQRIYTNAVVWDRFASPGAFIRGWYIDSLRVLSDADAVDAAARLIADLVANVAADFFVGIERAGGPLARRLSEVAESSATVVNLQLGCSLANLHGRFSCSDVELSSNCRAIVVDDIINSGWTARRAIRQLQVHGVYVSAVVCLVRYPRARPVFLRGWPGMVLSVYSLSDFALRRFALTRCL